METDLTGRASTATPARGSAFRNKPPSVRARRLLTGLMLLAAALMLLVVWPFRTPLFLAAVLAAAFQPLLVRAERRLHGRRRTAGALLTLLVLLVIVLPLGAVAGFLAEQVVSGLAFLRDALGIHSVHDLQSGALPPWAALRLDHLLAMVHLTPARLHEGVARAAATAEAAAPAALAESWRALFHTVVMLIAFYFLLLDGRSLIRWLRTVSPFEAEQTQELIDEFRRVASATLVGTALTALIQGVAAGIGFIIVGLPHPAFFGLLTGLAAFIPAVGTTLVWVPAVVLLALSGHPVGAAVLAAWCLVIVVGAEHVAKPFFLRGQMEMHTGLVFLGLLGGLEVFGLVGIIAGPLVVAFFISLLRLYARDFVAHPPVQA